MKRIKFLFKMAKKRSRTFLLICSLVIAVVIGLSLFGIFALKREREEINAQSNIERLKSLGYVAWTKVSEENKNKIGVTLYEPDKSYKGINVYSNHFGARKIIFMDMQGRIIHTFDIKEPHRYFDILKPYQQGFLLLVQPKLLKLNRKGEVEWKDKKGNGFHHDFWIADNDDIYALIHRPISKLRYYDRIITNFKDQALIILDSKRKVKKILPFSKLFKKELFSERSRILIQKQLDRNKKFITFFHVNTVEVINRNIGVAKEGDVLLSLCDLNLIAIVDVEKEKVIWSWGQGELEKQHHPSVLDNGNILIFDNGSYRKYSRVVELDPITKGIVWEYKADPPESFYSFGRGGAYALPNGNVLITESDKGHVFEVTRKGEKVWEFWNPSIKPKKDYVATTMKATIYRMQRFSPDILDRLP